MSWRKVPEIVPGGEWLVELESGNTREIAEREARSDAVKRYGSIARRAPLRPGEPLRRETPLRPINRERAAKREAKAFGAKARFVRTLHCLSCWSPPPSEAAHVTSRGAGGDSTVLVPLCTACHRRQHANGWVALGAPREWWLARAASLEARWQAMQEAA